MDDSSDEGNMSSKTIVETDEGKTLCLKNHHSSLPPSNTLAPNPKPTNKKS